MVGLPDTAILGPGWGDFKILLSHNGTVLKNRSGLYTGSSENAILEAKSHTTRNLYVR
jgi:hypothetical protein